ncbi:ankyrin repeat domain-containing protein [Leptospira sp. 96542]|nr:ankyrin repeat domain-containing protein [Leptospira sp. 96542]
MMETVSLKFQKFATLLFIFLISFLDFFTCFPEGNVTKTPPSPNLLFFQAIENGDAPTITELLDTGLPINVKDSLGNSGLIKATDEEEIQIVKILLSRKANVNLRNITGETALYRAVYRGNLELVKLLVQNGAETKIKTVGGVSLQELADERGEDTILRYLQNLK